MEEVVIEKLLRSILINSIWKKFLAIYLLVMLDFFLTVHVLALYGNDAELNPWLRFLMRTFKTTHAIGYSKVAGLTLLGACLFVAVIKKNLTILERISKMLTPLVWIAFFVVCYVGFIWIQLL